MAPHSAPRRIVIREALVWERARHEWEVEVYPDEEIVGVTSHSEPDGSYLSVLIAREGTHG